MLSILIPCPKRPTYGPNVWLPVAQTSVYQTSVAQMAVHPCDGREYLHVYGPICKQYVSEYVNNDCIVCGCDVITVCLPMKNKILQDTQLSFNTIGLLQQEYHSQTMWHSSR